MDYPIDLTIPCWYKEYCSKDGTNCRKICHRYLEMNCLINNCGMPNATKYLKQLNPSERDKTSFSRLQEIKDNVVDFVSEGRNLNILSPYIQTGKSSWALKILYKYFDDIWLGNGFRPRGYFIHIPDFLVNLKDFDYKKTDEYKNIIHLMKTVDLLVWDDLTTNYLTQSEQILIHSILTKRIQEDKSNIITGLVETEEKVVIEKLGKTLYERIMTFPNIPLVGGIEC